LRQAKDKNLAKQQELDRMHKAKERFDQEHYSDKIPAMKKARERQL
jgi:hypothetical protein